MSGSGGRGEYAPLIDSDEQDEEEAAVLVTEVVFTEPGVLGLQLDANAAGATVLLRTNPGTQAAARSEESKKETGI